MLFRVGHQVSKIGVPGRRASAGVGYICIPKDISPDIYKKSCLQKGRVSLQCEYERLDNVRIAKHMYNDLKFPTEHNKVGSAVVWINVPKHNQPVAVAVLYKESEIASFDENSFVLSKDMAESRVEIIGNAKEAVLNINVESKSVGASALQINILNKDNNANLGVNVNGTIDIESNTTKIKVLNDFLLQIKNDVASTTSQTDISYKIGEGFNYTDEFGNKLTIDKDGKFNITNENYSLSDLFNDLITQISAITVATAIGVQPIVNKVEVEQLKENVKKILL